MRVKVAGNAGAGQGTDERRHLEALAMIAGGLAHDLNNHLTMIAHTAELEQMLNDPARHDDAWKQIMHLCNQARETVRKIQAFGRKAPLLHKPVNMAALTNSTMKLLRRACSPRLRLDLKVESPEAWVSGIETQLETVLIHLVMISADSLVGASGSVCVRLAKTPPVPIICGGPGAKPSGTDAVYLSVYTETAPGDMWRAAALIDAPAADISSPEEHSQALLREIICAHGGTSEVIADQKGAACGLMIGLPTLKPVTDERNLRKLGPTIRGPRLNGLRVALVEDEVKEGDMLRNALIQEGARVCAFNSAADFSRWLKGGDGPDVLIADWVLADGAGDELVRQVRASDPDAPVILMSGRLQENELADGVLTGRSRFLGKPFTMEALILLLEGWKEPR